MSLRVIFSLMLSTLLLAGCAQRPSYDYSNFKESRPTSILVLPPVNHSPDVKAGASLQSQITFPLAESGYYVLPVAVTNETFRQNGVTEATDIHALPTQKLHEIYGADTALYLDIKDYGTSYLLISSATVVTASARLVDLRTGKLLWEGTASASSAEQQSNSGGSLIGMLVVAVVNQIVDTVTDKGHEIAGITSFRLLSADMPNSILYGPYSPKYQKK
ncbi:putative lipoprotein [compost metagenome]